MDTPELQLVIMAKAPQPGRVKTRLVRLPSIDHGIASEISRAMLRCTVLRLHQLGPVTLAVTPDDSRSWVKDDVFPDRPAPIEFVTAQGPGNLGQRLQRVWREVGGVNQTMPTCFFGGDSPDVPESFFHEIRASLIDNDLAIGPTDDGGYWCLAGRRSYPQVLEEIDWGGTQVYHQTLQKTRQLGLKVHELPAWRDVDVPEDLEALRRRLVESTRLKDDTALDDLASRLDTLLGPLPVSPES